MPQQKKSNSRKEPQKPLTEAECAPLTAAMIENIIRPAIKEYELHHKRKSDGDSDHSKSPT